MTEENLLGKTVKASVIIPIGYEDNTGYTYPLNYAQLTQYDDEYAYIMGVDRMVPSFKGEVVAALVPFKKNSDKKTIWILAEAGRHYISAEIEDALEFGANFKGYRVASNYEASAGAVVYRNINGRLKYLLIKNHRSEHWGFPKGHIERGETKYDAARREVLEETGIHVKIHLGYEGISNYIIGNKVHKKVSVFVGTTSDVETIIQRSEIDEFVWLSYDQAMEFLTFENDKKILEDGVKFLMKKQYIIDEVTPRENLEIDEETNEPTEYKDEKPVEKKKYNRGKYVKREKKPRAICVSEARQIIAKKEEAEKKKREYIKSSEDAVAKAVKAAAERRRAEAEKEAKAVAENAKNPQSGQAEAAKENKPAESGE